MPWASPMIFSGPKEPDKMSGKPRAESIDRIPKSRDEEMNGLNTIKTE